MYSVKFKTPSKPSKPETCGSLSPKQRFGFPWSSPTKIYQVQDYEPSTGYPQVEVHSKTFGHRNKHTWTQHTHILYGTEDILNLVATIQKVNLYACILMLVDMWTHLSKQISKHGTTASILSLATSLKKKRCHVGCVQFLLLTFARVILESGIRTRSNKTWANFHPPEASCTCSTIFTDITKNYQLHYKHLHMHICIYIYIYTISISISISISYTCVCIIPKAKACAHIHIHISIPANGKDNI